MHHMVKLTDKSFSSFDFANDNASIKMMSDTEKQTLWTFISAIQDQVINTNNYKKVLNDLNNCSDKCHQKSEIIRLKISRITYFVNIEYLQRHNQLCQIYIKSWVTNIACSTRLFRVANTIRSQ